MHRRTSDTPGIVKTLGVVAGAALLCLAACGEGVYGDRKPTAVDNIHVDSVRILPFGSRFVIADAPTRLRFMRFNTGYTCSEVLRMELSSLPSGSPAAFRPVSRIRLPSVPDCALDSAGRDTTVIHIFSGNLDSARVANSSGQVTDRAQVVRGTLGLDSLVGVLGPDGTLSKGPWTFRDSSSQAPRMLFGEPLVSCRAFNQASYARFKDSVSVRFSYVTLDPSADLDYCQSGAHADSIATYAYRQEN
ncbi:MAG: hypothetical protein ABIW76_20705 [Fibrobacteria bacterium]